MGLRGLGLGGRVEELDKRQEKKEAVRRPPLRSE